jgi:hypothetical protein
MDNDLRPGESDLMGQWLDTGSRIEGDATSARITWLVAERLERLGSDASGRDTLYRDPRDGRLWEHTYPHGELHGGGPPRLSLISRDAAEAKYRSGTT